METDHQSLTSSSSSQPLLLGQHITSLKVSSPLCCVTSLAGATLDGQRASVSPMPNTTELCYKTTDPRLKQ